MRSFSVTVLLLCACTYVNSFGAEKLQYDVKRPQFLFKKFVKFYNKDYDVEMYDYRYEIFKKNLKKINRLNQDTEITYGLTSFADVSESEIKRYTGYVRDDIEEGNTIDFSKLKEPVPKSFDWKTKLAVTPVKHQGRCASSYIFSVIANVEAQSVIKNGNLLSLSEQQILDCSSNTYGCKGGSVLKVLEYIHPLYTKKGIMLEKDYQYQMKLGECRYDQEKFNVTLAGYEIFNKVPQKKLKILLKNRGPLTVELAMNPTYMYYKKGIIESGCPGDIEPNHAALLVGYGTENNVPYWLIKNSWGNKWGENGYFRVRRGRNVCGIRNRIFTTTVQ